MKRRIAIVSTAVLFMAAGIFNAGSLYGQNVRQEAVEHPRLAAAVQALEAARVELQAAPHDFGGHKAAALRTIDAALAELRAALQFRASVDRRR